jgi:prophage regulatory protein
MKLIRLPDVLDRTGLSRSTIYERMAKGTFPKSVPLGPQLRGWVEKEINDYIAARIAERDAPPEAA